MVFLRKHGMYIPPELEAARRRILFVDDKSKLLGALKRAMKPHEAEVEFVTAESGVDALVMIGASKPDFLFFDPAMPGLDGFDVLFRLKARPDTSGIDVVLTTDGKSRAMESRALALGAKAVIDKPVSAAQMIELSSTRARA